MLIFNGHQNGALVKPLGFHLIHTYRSQSGTHMSTCHSSPYPLHKQQSYACRHKVSPLRQAKGNAHAKTKPHGKRKHVLWQLAGNRSKPQCNKESKSVSDNPIHLRSSSLLGRIPPSNHSSHTYAVTRRAVRVQGWSSLIFSFLTTRRTWRTSSSG
jgi:hypothetical protein